MLNVKVEKGMKKNFWNNFFVYEQSGSNSNKKVECWKEYLVFMILILIMIIMDIMKDE